MRLATSLAWRSRPASRGSRCECGCGNRRRRALAARRRSLAGPTGCGLCGVDSLAAAARVPPRVGTGFTIRPATIHAALADLAPAQALGATTLGGACGRLVGGRDHRAARRRRPPQRARQAGRGDGAAGTAAEDGLLLLTSRVSVEMVQKAAMMGAQVLVAVSAPTALAVRTAEAAGMTLVAVAREDGFEVFTARNGSRHDQRRAAPGLGPRTASSSCAAPWTRPTRPALEAELIAAIRADPPDRHKGQITYRVRQGPADLPGDRAVTHRPEPRGPDLQGLQLPHRGPDARMAERPEIVELVADLLGPDIDCFQSQLILKNPGVIGQPWHQDSYYFRFDRQPQVGVWVALTQATLENGCLWVQPGSHAAGRIFGHLPDRRPAANRGYLEIVDQDVSGKVRPSMAPGDVLVFHSYLMHMSTDNVADRPPLRPWSTTTAARAPGR
jgi:formate dehydrogenase accessory protein FdhD